MSTPMLVNISPKSPSQKHVAAITRLHCMSAGTKTLNKVLETFISLCHEQLRHFQKVTGGSILYEQGVSNEVVDECTMKNVWRNTRDLINIYIFKCCECVCERKKSTSLLKTI